jgi:hypothetical protein
MVDESLINPSDYMFHYGQFTRVTLDAFGETSSSTINTISCFVYQEGDTRVLPANRRDEVLGMTGIIPSSVPVQIGDFLNSVVDKNGVTIMASGKITKIYDFNTWYSSQKFKQVQLEIA